MSEFPALFAYFGPETMLPVTSIFATIAGVFLMMGRAGWRLIFGRKLFRLGRVPASTLRGHHLGARRRADGPGAAVAPPLVGQRADAGPAESSE